MIAVIMEFLVWLVDFLFSKRKSYEGRHWTDTVSIVKPDYYPDAVGLAKYPGLWQARMYGTAYYLKERVSVLQWAVRQRATQNWGWLNYSTDEWPEVWSVRNG